MVAGIGHIDIARAIGCDAARQKETCRGPGSIGAANNAGRTGERAHDACGRDLADGVVEHISDIDIARAVGGDAARGIKARRGPGRVGVAGQARSPCERAHYARGRDLADGVVAFIGHIDVARAVAGDTARGIKARRRPGAVGTPKNVGGTGEGAHGPGGRDLADGVILPVGHIEVARAVGGDAAREIKTCRGPGAIDVTRAPHIPGKERKRSCSIRTPAAGTDACQQQPRRQQLRVAFATSHRCRKPRARGGVFVGDHRSHDFS